MISSLNSPSFCAVATKLLSRLKHSDKAVTVFMNSISPSLADKVALKYQVSALSCGSLASEALAAALPARLSSAMYITTSF